MSLNSNIPKKSHLSVIGGIFKAVLNSPTIGKYDFTQYAPAGNRFNVAIDLNLQMNPNYLYFFHEMSFSMACAEETLLSSIDPGTVPRLTIRDSSTAKNIFHAPFLILKYFENASVDSFHFNSNLNSRIVADFQGVIVQTAPLIGTIDLYAQVSFMVYEIADPDFIAAYKREGKK